MPPTKLFAGFGILFCLFSFCAPIASGQGSTSTTYFYCFTQPIDGTQYLAAISWNSARDPREGFGDFLVKTYSLQRNSSLVPVCISEISMAAAQDMVKKNIDAPVALRSVHARKVDTHWNPASTQGAAPSAAQTPAQSTTAVLSYVVCAASSPSKMTGYVSAVFPVTKTDDPAWTSAFTQFLRQKYSIPDVNFLGCDTTTLENAQLSKAQRIAGWRNRIDVVETGWTYGSVPPAPAARPATAPAAQAQAPAKPAAPGQPASTPSAPPAPSNSSSAAQPAGAAVAASGPPNKYGACIARGQGVVYFSAPFKVTDRLYYKWQQAFGEFLQKKYQYGAGAIGCSDNGSLAEAQGYLKKYDDALRPTAKIIETGWKYQ